MGLASWAVPFLAAFGFYDREGQLAVDIFTFKTAMILVGGLVGAGLLVRAFRHMPVALGSGVVLGLSWAVINWTLDLAVLVGAMGSEPGAWFWGIGLRYLMLPIMAGAMGAVGAAQRPQ
jgi:hypothetical protein